MYAIILFMMSDPYAHCLRLAKFMKKMRSTQRHTIMNYVLITSFLRCRLRLVSHTILITITVTGPNTAITTHN